MDERRRLSFGSVAELYDRSRPGYPDGLIDDVIAYAGCQPGDRALEVGAGTGKATLQFAGRGLEITALEPSGQMAAVASQQAATAGANVRIMVVEFEAAEVPPGSFRLVYSGQAWHWITPHLRYRLARCALGAGGALAAFWNQADWERCELRGELRAAYERSGARLIDHGPMYPGDPSPLDLGTDWEEQISASEGFAEPQVRRYTWSADYTVEDYVELLKTHSDHIALEPRARETLWAEVASTIARHGGRLRLPYSTLLCLARAG